MCISVFLWQWFSKKIIKKSKSLSLCDLSDCVVLSVNILWKLNIAWNHLCFKMLIIFTLHYLLPFFSSIFLWLKSIWGKWFLFIILNIMGHIFQLTGTDIHVMTIDIYWYSSFTYSKLWALGFHLLVSTYIYNIYWPVETYI